MTRHEFLRELHRLLTPRTYLEVGVQHGWSLQLASGSALAIGIDPAPDLRVPIGSALVFRMTSDEFFARPTDMTQTPIDLGFVDGEHLYEYVLRDFANVEHHAHPGTVVVFDDVLPRNQTEAARAQCPGDWTGDVWRIEPILRHWRPDLHLTLVDTQPTGLLLVRGLDPASTRLADAYGHILAAHPPTDLPVPNAVLNRAAALNPDTALLDIDHWRAAL